MSSGAQTKPNYSQNENYMLWPILFKTSPALHSFSLPGESHGWRNLTGYSPWSCKESNVSEATEHARRPPNFKYFSKRLDSSTQISV